MRPMSLGFSHERTRCVEGITGLTQCGYGLPSGWCCPASTACLALNNTGTTASICCPNGSDCTTIQPITCNKTEQDPSQFPQSSLHLADLSQDLPKCGSNCCPLGYTCTSSGACQMLDQTKAAPSASPSTVSSTASATPRPTTSSSPAKVSPVPEKRFSGSSFVAGFIPGIVIGLLLAAAVAFILSHRRKKNDRDSIFGNQKPDRQISDPIYHPQLTARTDFLNHKRSGSAESDPSAGTPVAYAQPMTSYYNPTRPDTGTTAVGSPERRVRPVERSMSPSTPSGKVRGLFSRTSNLKKHQVPVSPHGTTHKSAASTETIDVLMGNAWPIQPTSHGNNANGFLGTDPYASGNPYGRGLPQAPKVTRKHDTTYSDVLRAAGASESQAATPHSTPSPAKKHNGRPPLKLGSPYRAHDPENKF